MKSRLIDIASALKLDVSTVSRGLHDDKRVHEETRTLIKNEAIKQGYLPNIAAQTLVTGKTNIIWLLVPSLRGKVEQEPALHAGLKLLEHNYDLHIIPHHDRTDVIERLIQQLGQGAADGTIIIPGQFFEEKHVDMLNEKKIPFIFMDRYLENCPESIVTSENQIAAKRLSQLLLDAGALQAIIGFHESNVVERERKAGVLSLLTAKKIPFKFIDENLSKLSNEKRTALIFSSQYVLTSLKEKISFLQSENIVVGVFDSWLGAKHPYYKVYVSIQNFESMAEEAVKELMSKIEGKSSRKKLIKIPCNKYIEID